MKALATVVQDLRFAIRAFRRRPGFLLTALVTLAASIGLATSVATVVEATLFRALPFRDPERLIQVFQRKGASDPTQYKLSWPAYKDLELESATLRGVAVYTPFRGALHEDAESIPIDGLAVSAAFLDVLGIRPHLGRGFVAGEDVAGAEEVCLLAYDFWKQRFGGRPSVLGQRLRIDGDSVTIVGVLPKEFIWPGGQLQVLTTVQPNQIQAGLRTFWHFATIARLAEGVSAPLAQERLKVLADAVRARHPDAPKETTFEVAILKDEFVRPLRAILVLLLCFVGVLYLLASANVAGLLLAHAASRHGELSVRSALGASKRRIVRQLLTESALIAAIGTVLGVMLAHSLVGLLLKGMPATFRSMIRGGEGLGLEGRTLAACVIFGIVTTLVCGVLPAFRGASTAGFRSLGDGNVIAGHYPLRRLLITVEVAAAVALLYSASLLSKSFMRVVEADPGFRAQGVASLEVRFTQNQFENESQIPVLLNELQRGARETPGIQSAAIIDQLPGVGAGGSVRFRRSDQASTDAALPQALYRRVSPDYFKTLGVPVLAGRPFDGGDRETSPPVVIINQALQRSIFPGENPLGRTLQFLYRPDAPAATVVGVVGNEAIGALDEKRNPAVYVPLDQAPYSANFWVVTRALGYVDVGVLRARMAAVAPGAAVMPAHWLTDEIDRTPAMFLRRYPAFLLRVFSIAGLVVAVGGIFSLIASTVFDHRRSFGLRLAMGASGRDIKRLVLSETFRFVWVGALSGVGLALVAAALFRSLLYEATPWDPVSLLGVLVLLVAASSLAALGPAIWASRVDPIAILRDS